MTTIPMVLDARDGRGYDIFSRLLRDRIVLLSGPVTEEQAASVIAQLLFLEAEDPEKMSLSTSTLPADWSRRGLPFWIPCTTSVVTFPRSA